MWTWADEPMMRMDDDPEGREPPVWAFWLAVGILGLATFIVAFYLAALAWA
jgi:hypothetical protein